MKAIRGISGRIITYLRTISEITYPFSPQKHKEEQKEITEQTEKTEQTE
jgi:DNA-directed RNA polymerase specialized sigma subunit